MVDVLVGEGSVVLVAVTTAVWMTVAVWVGVDEIVGDGVPRGLSKVDDVRVTLGVMVLIG